MSASPTKEGSPVKPDKSIFTEKEERVLKAAWSCLKSPPEIDIEKLVVAAGFNTSKTASNTWGTSRRSWPASLRRPPRAKVHALSTPKAKPTPKKRAKKAAAIDDADDADVETPSKKQRKTPKKVKAGQDETNLTQEQEQELFKEEPFPGDAGAFMGDMGAFDGDAFRLD